MLTRVSRSTGTPRLLAVSGPLSMALKFQRFPRKYSRDTSVMTKISPISRQLARPRSPKVQYTTEATFTSSAKYCTMVVPPLNRELRATPANTMVAGVTLAIRDRPRMITVVRKPPAKAQRVTI